MESAASYAYKPSTLLNYYRVFEKLKIFLTQFNANFVLPIESYYVYLYVGQLITQRTPASSIRSSLSAISWLHKMHNVQDPTIEPLMKKVLLGIKRMQARKPELLPLDRELLQILCSLSYSLIPSQYDQKLIRVVLQIMYYACLRVGEAVGSASTEHTLRLANVAISKGQTPVVTFMFDSYKHSKMPKRIELHSAPQQPHCPVTALRDYLAVRCPGADTLFNDQRGKTATRQFVAEKLKFLVSHAGLDPTRYNTHSLRIGRTTDLAKEGVPEAIIRETGRWESDAYKRYIRFPAFILPR